MIEVDRLGRFIKQDKDNLPKLTKELEILRREVALFSEFLSSIKVTEPKFDEYVQKRNELSIKLSNVERKIAFFKCKGSAYGEPIEAYLKP